MSSSGSDSKLKKPELF